VTLKEALIATRKTLISHHIEEPELESELLVRYATGLSKEQLYVQHNYELSDREAAALDEAVERRAQRETIAYILGYKEFFGLEFDVNPSVLIPRPETELLVEKAIEIARQQSIRLIADIGTGCGAIAISIAKHLPDTKIYAVDISKAVLEVAKTNCQKHDVTDSVHLLHGNLLEPIPEPVDLIVANLPYVKNDDWANLPAEVKANEPKSALAGGTKGLDAIKGLLAKAKSNLRPNAIILLEIGYDQGEAVLNLASMYFPKATTEIYADLAGLDRVVSIVI
jgi:release factor glutamine methyltransferase